MAERGLLREIPNNLSPPKMWYRGAGAHWSLIAGQKAGTDEYSGILAG